MNLKNLVSLAILFVLSFSIVHEYTFAYFDDEHCSATEYIAELESPLNHGDICDIHFEYHEAFLLLDLNTLLKVESSAYIIKEQELYTVYTPLNFLKPPIV